ncbi:hypothetical protein [Streptomyces sp. 1331.2]|uniref:hypothetical protein n=1 Tax=Streptomyces sp. 1331.2 TaxID=1938835 RepID=UPI000BD43658|nr:hypothetical protein [Streptomyces sp. 1331.2]SOB88936.1 hypothetical protein SAMN06272789_7258 [Streptomyces sp. 1331.2]
MELVNHRRPEDAAEAYINALGWPLSVGWRHRPRQGCACGTPDCSTSGAHPKPGARVLRDAEVLAQALQQAPGAGLIAWTGPFDALVVPRQLGMAAMIDLDAITPAPCIVSEETVTLLMLPATARYALRAGVPGEVRSGDRGWIAVPPSHGTRWDNLPWIEGTRKPQGLLHGRDMASALEEAARHYGTLEPGAAGSVVTA